MKLVNTLNLWKENHLISEKQMQNILKYEQNRKTNISLSPLYWIAGLLIGLGIIMIISANWSQIADLLKLIIMFSIMSLFSCALYISINRNKTAYTEFFITLSVLSVGACIGLMGQIFNLSGNWSTFSLAWALLSLIYVLFSKLETINILWLFLLASGVNFDLFDQFIRLLFRGLEIFWLAISVLIFGLLSFCSRKLYCKIQQKIILPLAFADLSKFLMYFTAIYGGIALGYDHNHSLSILANVFVFCFLGMRMLIALKFANVRSFVNNIHICEIYILYLFISRFNDLLISGIGFIISGILLLVCLYSLVKIKNYIKKLEMNNE